MENYIEAIRAAASSSDPRELKPVLDFILEQALEDYKGGALDVAEYSDIINEYESALVTTNAVLYM